VAAIIGVAVPGLIGGWLPGTNGDDEDDAATETTRSAPPIRPSRLVTSERVGLYNVELDGDSQGAINVHGPPRSESREVEDACLLKWSGGLEMDFYNLGGQDPCVYGKFCWAHITGSEWATSKGLRVGDRAQRMFRLYPDAEYVEEPELVRRYVIEPATAPCGASKGGLEAWTGGGRVIALRVSYLAGGD
jgi:hypothetical protein